VRFILTPHVSDFYLRNVKVAGELLRLSLLPGRHRNNPEFLFPSLKKMARKKLLGLGFFAVVYTVKKVCEFPVPRMLTIFLHKSCKNAQILLLASTKFRAFVKILQKVFYLPSKYNCRYQLAVNVYVLVII
jgi:hypothetical protein